MLYRSTLLCLFLTACAGQNLSVGFEGGGAVTNAYETNNKTVPGALASWSQAKDYLVGLTLEYRLLGDLSIESDAVYREQHMTDAFVEPNIVNNKLVLYAISPSPVVTWELPVMAKYRFHWGNAEPFIEAGPAFRPTTNLNANPSHYGFAAGAGVAMHWRSFEIAPSLRYERWAGTRIETAIPRADQIEALVGVSNHPRSAWHPLSSRIHVGVIAGMTLLHDVPSSSSATTTISGNYTLLIGPSLEAALLKGLFIETDAFYHPLDVTERTVLSDGSVSQSFSGRESQTWEFPVLLKQKFGAGRFRPFIETGPSFRLLVENSSLVGITGGAGVETRVHSLKIAPSVRFTHWGPQGRHSPSTEMIVNQWEFLTSFVL